MTQPPPRILIVEDEPVIAEDIADLCSLHGYEVCGTAFSADEALTLAERHRPTLVLLDINLQNPMNGMDVADVLKKKYRIPFLYITSYSDRDTLARASQTAPLGFIVKPFTPNQLFSTIEIAWAQVQQSGQVLFDVDKVSRRLVEPLSSREAEVLDCVVRGMNTKGVAAALYISENTVKFHLKNLYDKFDVHNRVELVAAVREMG